MGRAILFRLSKHAIQALRVSEGWRLYTRKICIRAVPKLNVGEAEAAVDFFIIVSSPFCKPAARQC